MSEFSRRALFGLFGALGVSTALPAAADTAPLEAIPKDEGYILAGGMLIQRGRFDHRRKRKPWPAYTAFGKPFDRPPEPLSAYGAAYNTRWLHDGSPSRRARAAHWLLAGVRLPSFDRVTFLR